MKSKEQFMMLSTYQVTTDVAFRVTTSEVVPFHKEFKHNMTAVKARMAYVMQ